MKVALLLALPLALASADMANPMGQVIALMNGLAAKITAEGEAEAKAYKEFFEWCDSASKNKGFEIQTAKAKKEKLEAEIEKQTSAAAAAATKIEELAASIATDEAELKEATGIREKEAAEFAGNEAELADVVDTLGRAIGLLEKEMSKNPAAFAQLHPDTSSLDGLVKSLGAVADAAAFTAADKQKILSLVQNKQAEENDDEDWQTGAPAAAVYKSHSSNIIEVLEDMKEKAEEQLAALRKAETSAKHNYNMLKQSLDDEVAADTADMNEEKNGRAAAEEAKATATADLAATTKDLADGNEALELTHSSCMTTAADHEASVNARTEELGVIAKAKAILEESSAGAVSQTYLQIVSVQASGSRLHTHADLKNMEVVTVVKRLAQEHHSAALAQLASKISALVRYGAADGEDPFAKVKGLITDMIAKLEDEAKSEATEKAYCDEQLAKTEAKKGELEYDLSKVGSKIDKAAAASAGLKEEVKELQAELAALAKEQAEMDATRQEGNAAYTVAKADLEAGLEGVRKALGVLREYYGGAASAAADAALLQQGGTELGDLMRAKQPAMPENHESHSGAGSSIIGILEVCESDFAKNLATEEAEEADSQSEYDTMTQKNKMTKTLKDQDVKYKTQEFKGLDKTISELTADRDTMMEEQAAVLDYYTKIKERCIAKPETYEERKKRREAEIAGLKEALATLEEETAFVQHGKRGHRGQHFLGL